MAIKESILPEFEKEMETTRLVLERVPDACAQWKPHPKSRSLGELSSHLADIPRFVPWILTSESFDAAPPGGQAYRFPRFESTEKLVSNFNENVGTARAAIAAVPADSDFMVPWTQTGGPDVFYGSAGCGAPHLSAQSHDPPSRAADCVSATPGRSAAKRLRPYGRSGVAGDYRR